MYEDWISPTKRFQSLLSLDGQDRGSFKGIMFGKGSHTTEDGLIVCLFLSFVKPNLCAFLDHVG